MDYKCPIPPEVIKLVKTEKKHPRVSEFDEVVKECKQAVSYVPAKGPGGIWDSPAEDEYFTYYRSSGSGFSTPPKFESREAAEKDCIMHRRND